MGELRADAVSRAHVAILHTHVSRATPGQANRLLAIIKTMWKKAAMWGYVAESYANPAAVGVTMNKEFARERFIKPSELPRLISAVEQEPDIRVRGALWLFLLTGARKSEMLEATWENVDLERRELRVPKPKQGKPHVYPLSTRAMQVMEQLPRFAGNPYLIPGDKPGGIWSISRSHGTVSAAAQHCKTFACTTCGAASAVG